MNDRTIALLRQALLLGWVLLVAGGMLRQTQRLAAQDLLTIGQIQGRGAVSDFVDRRVHVRAIVTGILEDENASGTRFYTLFVQDVPGGEDGDPVTSDGLAIFAGARRPAVTLGDIIVVSGYVTEFYGLTELDNSDLTITIESRNNPLPEPVEINPPASNEQAADYLEQYEAMRVTIPESVVVGPSHVGCGFSVAGRESGIERPMARSAADPSGQIVGVLHPSDVDCQEMPAMTSGDVIEGLTGPLTYHFDRFKVVYQDASGFLHQPADPAKPESAPTGEVGQLVLATFNLHDLFDGQDDTGSDAEAKLTEAELSLKLAKLAATIGEGLNCPDVLGVQEAETSELLAMLAANLADRCGFVYEVSHLDGPDPRGADVALLSSPETTSVVSIVALQSCIGVPSGVVDTVEPCPPGRDSLHARPPLQVELAVDGQSLFVLVNHFKSKRGGAEQTAAQRLAQAQHLNRVVREINAKHSDSAVIVMGDFNDYDRSAVMDALTDQGVLVDALSAVPAEERYSYIFDGLSQLIDWILVSPAWADRVGAAGIWHGNADYPVQLGHSADPVAMRYRSSDHDAPYIVLNVAMPAMPGPTSAPRPTQTSASTARSSEALIGDTPNDEDQSTASEVAAFIASEAKQPSSSQVPTKIAMIVVGLVLLGGGSLIVASVARRSRG